MARKGRAGEPGAGQGHGGGQFCYINPPLTYSSLGTIYQLFNLEHTVGCSYVSTKPAQGQEDVTGSIKCPPSTHYCTSSSRAQGKIEPLNVSVLHLSQVERLRVLLCVALYTAGRLTEMISECSFLCDQEQKEAAGESLQLIDFCWNSKLKSPSAIFLTLQTLGSNRLLTSRLLKSAVFSFENKFK